MKKLDPVSLIGSIVCALALVGIFFYNYQSLKKQQQNAPIVTSAEAEPQVQQPIAATPDNAAVAQAAQAAVTAVKEQIQREPVELAVPGQFKVVVDAMGRGVQKVTLDNYTIQTKKPEHKNDQVVMGQEKAPFLSLDVNGIALYEIAEPEITEKGVQTHRSDAAAAFRYDESWELVPAEDQPYSIQYTLKVTNTGSAATTVPQMLLSSGVLPDFLSDESNTSFSRYLSGCVAYGRASKDDAKTLSLKEISPDKMDDAKMAKYLVTPANWLGVSSKYFLFALREPKMGGQPTVFPGFLAKEPQEFYPQQLFAGKAVLPTITLQPGESQVITVTGYAGPKSYQLLEPMGHGISSILNMDLFFFWHCNWMGWLCKMLLKALNGIAGWFSPACAYGLAIILITLIVKAVFMPLMWHSTRSMKKMSAVQPQLKVLREKYKNDPQRMYYEQQKIFKENGVSQMGGCLPMLVQIPVFFAMFNTFRGAIEIRNAGFLWVSDLSMPDPIFGLPIHPLAIMTGVTMFLQQRLQPMPDPNQAKMMNIMSLVFVVFFYNMPAGLTLYMTVNQLFTIVQMLCFKKLEKKTVKAA